MSEESISVSSYFECPSCKRDVLDEVMIDVVVSTHITDIYRFDDNSSVEVGYDSDLVEDISYAGGVIDRYQCSNCGWEVKDEEGVNITDPADLADWLEEHKINREKELNTP